MTESPNKESVDNTDIISSRETFESWVMSDKSGFCDENGDISYTLLSRSDKTGRYYHEEIEQNWHVWQAAVAATHISNPRGQKSWQLISLLSCPFCGWHTPSLKDAGMGRLHVQCPGCGGSGGTCKGYSAAEKQWNTRADQQHKHSNNDGNGLSKRSAITIAHLPSGDIYVMCRSGPNMGKLVPYVKGATNGKLEEVNDMKGE